MINEGNFQVGVSNKGLSHCVVVIPTYNEAENIALLIHEILQFEGFDILVVDDSSPDGTGAIVSELGTEHARVQLLTRKEKNGIGPAYIAGFQHALSRGYRYIIQMDADFSHQPRYLPQLLALAQKSDLVIGSRYVQGGGVENWSVVRKLISRGGSIYAKLMLGLPINDCTGGFKCWQAGRLASVLDEGAIQSSGYMFQIEMSNRAHCQGAHMQETPIIFPDRVRGQSKMSAHIVVEASMMVLKMRWNQAWQPKKAVKTLPEVMS